MKVLKKKGFTLVELLVVVAILAILAAILLPRFLGYTDKAREAQTMKDIRSMSTIVEAFAATDGNYPEASLDTDNPRSIASIMQSKGVNWTGDATGKTDPWGNPYYYDVVGDYYCIASAGKDGTLNTEDDICNIGGKVSKKASGLDGNAIPSAVPGNNPGNGNEPGHITEVPEGYIGIYTPEQLASIGVDPDYPRDGNYIVMKDLDLSGYENWTPIGDISPQFTGTFDGNNYVISNLTINSDKNYIGLFGCISETSEIKKIGLENINVAGGDYVGGLVGKNYGTITDCYATGEVTGNENTGGLVGRTYFSPITNCYATGNITGNKYTGGLVGRNDDGTLTNCYATAEVIGGSNTGGLVGWNCGPIENCYATGNVNGADRTGGLVGRNDETLTNCYATGEVTGNNDYTGGLAGWNSITITNSYYNSETTGQSDNDGRGTPLTTAEMKNSANFTDWDFIITWSIEENNSYPYLQPNEQIPHPGT
jgi:type II secretion system protein G